MLTQDQIDAVTKSIELGKAPVFTFAGADLCDSFDEIIEHLESERIEDALFGKPMINGHAERVMYDTPEEAQRAFVHHTMHWAFQLGVGAALSAVGQDLEGSESRGEDPLD